MCSCHYVIVLKAAVAVPFDSAHGHGHAVFFYSFGVVVSPCCICHTGIARIACTTTLLCDSKWMYLQPAPRVLVGYDDIRAIDRYRFNFLAISFGWSGSIEKTALFYLFIFQKRRMFKKQ